MFVAAPQVYFRDLTNFLPYLLRIWLYISPILYYAEEVPEKLRVAPLRQPDGPAAGRAGATWSSGRMPPAGLLAAASSGRSASVIAGGLFFISREREFAVRL